MNTIKLNFKIKILRTNQAWWFMLIIPALGRLWQEDRKFKASLGYMESSRPTLAT
jgi:hypothetical protein